MKNLINWYITFNKLVRAQILSNTDLEAIKRNVILQDGNISYLKKIIVEKSVESRGSYILSFFTWSDSLEKHTYWATKSYNSYNYLNNK